MDTATRLAIGSALLSLAKGSSPVRRPSWNEPPFYSRPLTRTKTRYFPSNQPNWTNFLSVSGQPSYVGKIQSYCLGCEVPLLGSGIEFRFQIDGTNPQFVDLPVNAEISREFNVTDWPMFKKDFFQIILFTSTFTIQVRNISASPRRVFVGLFGYFYPDVDASAQSDKDDNRRG